MEDVNEKKENNNISVEEMTTNTQKVATDNKKQKKKRSGIVSSVIISVFIVLSIISMIFIVPTSVQDVLTPPGDDVSGFGAIFWAIFVGALGVVGLYFWAISTIVTHGICSVFSVVNIKSTKKPVKIYNIVLTCLNAIIVLIAVIKLILWALGM